MAVNEQFEISDPGNDLDLDNLPLNPENIIYEKVSDDFFSFITKTKAEGRKLGIAITRSVMKQRLGDNYNENHVNSLLQRLKEPGLIDDYRLDGIQLSYAEKYDTQNAVWEVSVLQRYGDTDDIDRLNRAVENLGFTTDKPKSE